MRFRDFFKPKQQDTDRKEPAIRAPDPSVEESQPASAGTILLPSEDTLPPTVHVAQIGGPRGIDKEVLARTALKRRVTPASAPEARTEIPKRGMWVRYSRSTGILLDILPGDIAKVMLVDRDGVNMIEVTVLAKELRQALIDEIPEARRQSEDALLRLGYTREI